MQKQKRKPLKTILVVSIISIFTLLLLSGLLFLLVYLGVFGPLPGEKELSAIQNEEASLVFSADQKIIGKYFAENRTNIRKNDIPVHLRNALIATEDKRFFSHKGNDIRSYFRVLFRSILLLDKSGGGGSTLTQQLAKNLYGRKKRGFLSLPINKMKEMIIASRMEKIYSKEELLLLYLNSVPFGEDVYGVESASYRFFSKPTRKLKIEESAVLIGILKANTYFNPQLNPENSITRRNLILNLMKDQHYISAHVADSLTKLPLRLKYENEDMSPTGYFVYQVKKKALEILEDIDTEDDKAYDLEKDGLKIYTTLNMQIQELAASAVKTHLSAMQKLLDKELDRSRLKKQWFAKQKKQSENLKADLRNRKVRLFDWKGMQVKNISKFDSLWYYYKMLHASVLITNPKSGEVITWIGGNHFKTLPFDMVLSHRQIASAFKPILFATALEQGIDPCKYLENTKTKYEGYENWEPENFDRSTSSDSTVALWYALAHSMNLPSVDLYFKVGKDNLSNTCDRLNFPRFTSDAPSNALGTLDLSLLEIVRAYGSFANDGLMNDLVMISKITDASGKVLYTRESATPEKVFDTETTAEITAILQEAINQGTGTRIRTQYNIKSPLAGKTGTAENYSNAWFIAYTPNFVIGTWVGASRPDVHFYSSNGSGSALALPIAANVIKKMESIPELKSRYLTSFTFSEDVYAFLQCDPFQETGIKGFFNRIFGKRDKNPEDTADIEEKEVKKERESFFRRLFGRKKE
jgi:penicillin-binding protein 1A